MNKILTWIIGVIVLVFVVWGLSSVIGGQSTLTDMENTEPIKIGFVGPLTGDEAAIGEDSRNIVELLVEDINLAGGVNGRDIEVVYEDGACTGASATSAVSKLINIDGVSLILGGVCSGESLAMVPIAEKNKVMIVNSYSTSPDLTGISDYFVRLYPSDAEQGLALAEYAMKNNFKVAILQEQNDYASAIGRVFQNNFKGEYTKEEFLSSTIDLRQSFLKLKSNNLDTLVLLPGTDGSAKRMLKQLEELDWDVNILVSEIIGANSDITGAYDSLLEGAISTTFIVDEENPEYLKFLNSYKERYGKNPIYTAYATTQYDAVMLVAEAIRDIGLDADGFPDWFRRVKDRKGLSGLITIRKDGDREAIQSMVVITDGKPIIKD